MPTSIKVSNELRDRLKVQATEHGRTLGEHLGVLADEADKRTRFARLRVQIAATPPELHASYLEEVRAWDPTTSDGVSPEDFSDWPGYAAT
jgi:hypothetical protein